MGTSERKRPRSQHSKDTAVCQGGNPMREEARISSPLAAVSPGRRTFLKGLAAGVVGVGGVSLLSACTGASAGSTGSSAKTTSFGSNASDAVPKKAYAAVVAAFEKQSGDKGTTNTVDHNSFQDKINNYLQSNPDPVFTWFAGYRMKYYAAKGLVAPLDEVWSKIGADNFGQGIQTASTGDDGKKYFVPNYN